MEMDITPIQGKEALLRRVNALAPDKVKKVVVSALHKSGNLVVQNMRQNAPDAPNTPGSVLAKAVNKTQAKTGQKLTTGAGRRFLTVSEGAIGMIVGPNKKVDGHYRKVMALWTEYGTSAHTIRAKRRFLWIGGRFAGGSVRHPGIQGTRWMEKSLDQARGRIEQEFYSGLERWLDKNGR